MLTECLVLTWSGPTGKGLCSGILLAGRKRVHVPALPTQKPSPGLIQGKIGAWRMLRERLVRLFLGRIARKNKNETAGGQMWYGGMFVP